MRPLSAPHHLPNDGQGDFDVFLVERLEEGLSILIRDLAEWRGTIDAKAGGAVL